MNKVSNQRDGSKRQLWEHLFTTLLGVFVALALLKLGNPVILEQKIEVPKTSAEFLYQPWPIDWGYVGLFVILAASAIGRWKKIDAPIVFLLIWFGWQLLSATQSVSPSLTASTLKHFAACLACFFIGWYALSEVKSLAPLWIGILIGFVWMLRVGLEQHFGGLESARKHFEIYILPTLSEPPVDLIKKMATNRIFSTLFYPNTFAGAILLFLPLAILGIWELGRRLLIHSRLLLASLLAFPALVCLYWSGSKSGWLLMLLMILAAGWRLPAPKRAKQAIFLILAVAGIIGFFLKYAHFFERGAPSVVARTDYWSAAVQICAKNPFFGTGPGTFSIPYHQIKTPEAEMARLCHNDYLEQASDSGILGFLAFFVFILATALHLYRHRNIIGPSSFFAIGLGVAAVFLQSFSEFNLYVPALAWTSFLFMGFLLGVLRNRLDKKMEGV